MLAPPSPSSQPDDDTLLKINAINMTACDVHVFDCTVPVTTKPPARLGTRVNFHRMCLDNISHTSQGRTYLSWPALLQSAGLTSAPVFVKMDIEGFEYPVLRSILPHDARWLPAQLAVEMHYRTR